MHRTKENADKIIEKWRKGIMRDNSVKPINEQAKADPPPCCRLSQECIMAVVRNRSGIDAGEIDYTLRVAKFDRMSVGCLEDAIKTIDVLRKKCADRIQHLIG